VFPQQPIQIDPDAIYTEGVLATLLDLKLSTLLRARSRGELRYVRRGNRVLIHGRDVLNWLKPEAGQEGRANAV
jgi:excisionase family DNA binding protein